MIVRCIVSLVLAGIMGAGVAVATSKAPWDGGYIGFDLGDGSSSTCSSLALEGVAINPTNASQFTSANCSKSGALGGLEVGENFQYRRFVWGLGAELDYWDLKTINQTVKYVDAAPPPGRYTFSSKQGPSEFAIIGSRIGYGGDTWLPYLRVGGILSAGAHDSALSYSPTSATTPAASFRGGTNFSTAGWVAGGGFELGLNGAWSLTAEYLHASLGKGSDSTGTCNGSAAACGAFSGMTFETQHGGFSANIFRLGITYWFNYWDL
jgi:hypothetical protein